MTSKIMRFIFVLMLFLTAACVKETYDMNKLSSKAHLTPTMALSAVNGKILFSDMVKSGDTVVFDQNNFVKIIFKQDSLIDLKLADFYDLEDMVAFNQTYTIGELKVDPFSLDMNYSVSPVEALIGPTPVEIPSFGSINLGEQEFPLTNIQNAVFSSGSLDITIMNNLPVDLNSISLRLYSGSGSSRTMFVPVITIPPIPKGTSQIYSINLANKTLLAPLSAAVVLSGSPGTSTPVLITQDNSNIHVTISGSSMVVTSGTVILPPQMLSDLDNKDTISFDPGSGVEIDEMKISTGNVTYYLQSTSSIPATINVSLPTALRSGTAISEVINVPAASSFTGSISFNNTTVDLGTDPDQPYNSIPMVYDIIVNSNNSLISFNSTDEISLDLKLQNPVFDYVKGYFGQMEEVIDPDSIELDIQELLSKITGDFLISSPSIKLNYSNSFAIPIEMSLNATGKRSTSIINLGLDPFIVAFPAAPASRDVSASFIIDKTNSSLPELISLPPELMKFSGSVKMNPLGDPTHLRNNYIFDDSRFLGSLEVEVPLELRLNNLQFADTVDNFMKDDNGDSPVSFENFSLLRVDLSASNGFPLGISVKMSLYDSVTKTTKATVDATDLLKPASVDNTGKAIGAAESNTSIEITKSFFESVTKADKIIFRFTLNTTDNGTKDVKIYSNYSIEFNAALIVKPDFNLK